MKILSVLFLFFTLCAVSIFPVSTPVTATEMTYPSHTLGLNNSTISNNTAPTSAAIVLTLVIGFALVAWGFLPNERHWHFLAGFYWIAFSVLVLLDYGALWMVTGLGIGLTLIAENALYFYGRGGEDR